MNFSKTKVVTKVLFEFRIICTNERKNGTVTVDSLDLFLIHEFFCGFIARCSYRRHVLSITLCRIYSIHLLICWSCNSSSKL